MSFTQTQTQGKMTSTETQAETETPTETESQAQTQTPTTTQSQSSSSRSQLSRLEKMPDDILAKICSVLKIKENFLISCVSTTLYGTITGPEFRELILLSKGDGKRMMGFFHHKKKLTLSLLGQKPDLLRGGSHYTECITIRGDSPSLASLHSWEFVVGSTNGLVLVLGYSGTLFIVELLTMKRVSLPAASQRLKFLSYGFVYNGGFGHEVDFDVYVLGSERESMLGFTVDSFSSRTNLWSRCSVTATSPFSLTPGSSASSLLGNLFWLGQEYLVRYIPITAELNLINYPLWHDETIAPGSRNMSLALHELDSHVIILAAKLLRLGEDEEKLKISFASWKFQNNGWIMLDSSDFVSDFVSPWFQILGFIGKKAYFICDDRILSLEVSLEMGHSSVALLCGDVDFRHKHRSPCFSYVASKFPIL